MGLVGTFHGFRDLLVVGWSKTTTQYLNPGRHVQRARAAMPLRSYLALRTRMAGYAASVCGFCYPTPAYGMWDAVPLSLSAGLEPPATSPVDDVLYP